MAGKGSKPRPYSVDQMTFDQNSGSRYLVWCEARPRA